jgi:hypothetical protein
MKEFQTYGLDAAGNVTHAGTHRAKRFGPRIAKRHQAEWERWRAQFLAENPGDYPLRHVSATAELRVHPVGRPDLCVSYRV